MQLAPRDRKSRDFATDLNEDQRILVPEFFDPKIVRLISVKWPNPEEGKRALGGHEARTTRVVRS